MGNGAMGAPKWRTTRGGTRPRTPARPTMLQFQCQCGKQLQAREEYAGQLTQCPSCGRQMNTPRPDAAIQPAAAVPARVEQVTAAPPRPRAWDEEDNR